MIRGLLIGLATLMAVQVNAGTTIEVEPGEVFTVMGVDPGFTKVIDDSTGVTYLPMPGTTGTATSLAANKKTCSKEDLHKLLYQARQHMPRSQSESMVTFTTSSAVYEKKSSKLRREARELDAYDEWLDIVDKAVDKDECD